MSKFLNPRHLRHLRIFPSPFLGLPGKVEIARVMTEQTAVDRMWLAAHHCSGILAAVSHKNPSPPPNTTPNLETSLMMDAPLERGHLIPLTHTLISTHFLR